jgi:phage baseplate assembly protein W
MCRDTGKLLGELAHLKQSIVDILTTPIGSRLFELVDMSINDMLKVKIYSESAEALGRWEPRFKCSKVTITTIESGKIELLLEGEYLPNGQKIKLDGVVV